MAAQRTQIYLTEQQRAKLDALQRTDGRALADHVRAALDAYLAEQHVDLENALEKTFGIEPDLEVPSRDEWDR